MQPILFILLSFLLCLTGTPIIRQIAIKKGWLAFPEKDRWHEKPTALLGGIAIYVSIAIPLFIISDFKTILPDLFGASNFGALPSLSAAIFLGITALFILGLTDDFVHLKPQAKLVGQILAGALAGFLVYNFNPAFIFMGDCGSLVIGFSISILTLFYSEVGDKNGCSRIGLK